MAGSSVGVELGGGAAAHVGQRSWAGDPTESLRRLTASATPSCCASATPSTGSERRVASRWPELLLHGGIAAEKSAAQERKVLRGRKCIVGRECPFCLVAGLRCSLHLPYTCPVGE
jgi:hypothetical protein